MTEVRCVLLRHTGMCRLEMRRQAAGCTTNPSGWHTAVASGDDCAIVDDRGMLAPATMRWPRPTDGWPTSCACGYLFTESDSRQVGFKRLYAGDGVEATTAESAPPGSIMETADGALAVVTPTGIAKLDRAAMVGTPPAVTASMVTAGGVQYELVAGVLRRLPAPAFPPGADQA